MGCEIGRIRPTNVFERAGESRMTPPASSSSSHPQAVGEAGHGVEHHARNRPAARPYAARVRSFVDRGREELQKSLDGHYSVITASRMAAVSSPPNLELNTVMPTKLNPGGNSLSSLSNVPVRLVASRT